DRIKLVNHDISALSGWPALVTSLLGREPGSSAAASVLAQLSVSMRMHGRGGLLLVVPDRTDAWQESIVQPIRYSVSPPFLELADLMQQELLERRERRWQESTRHVIEAIAGLTAVDGATVITDQYGLLAFGAKIGRRDGYHQIDRLVLTEPIE